MINPGGGQFGLKQGMGFYSSLELSIMLFQKKLVFHHKMMIRPSANALENWPFVIKSEGFALVLK